jgi:hypothetical protein
MNDEDQLDAMLDPMDEEPKVHPLDQPLDHRIWKCRGYDDGIRGHLKAKWATSTGPKVHQTVYKARVKAASKIQPPAEEVPEEL